MDTASTPLRLQVFASTSNLGPGFDLLGLCLNLPLDLRVEVLEKNEPHAYAELQGEAKAWPAVDECLVLRAYDRLAGKQRRGLRLHVHSQIPICRGFGSSGAAVAAGLLLANHVHAMGLAPSALVELGLEIEGHPDNSTAALLGGCTLALPHANGVRVVFAEIHPAIGFVLAWPATPLATTVARRVLPKNVPFADAAENPRRLALLLAGLASGDKELLALGSEDRLHERYRLPHIPGGAAALAAAREAGAFAATISGSGSGLVALGQHADLPAIAAAMRSTLTHYDPPAEARAVEVVREAPRIRSLG